MIKNHIWDRGEVYRKMYELLREYGILLGKKHHRQRKAKMLKRVKEFAKKAAEDFYGND